MATLAERMAKSSTDYCVNWAAMLICGVPEEKVKLELSRATAHVHGGGMITHRDFPHLADVAKALHEAIEKDKIPCGEYGNGKGIKFLSQRYVLPAARTISRQDLKNYLLQIADPLEASELPSSLFSEAEREMHMARSPQAFENLVEQLKELKKEKDENLARLSQDEDFDNEPDSRKKTADSNLLHALEQKLLEHSVYLNRTHLAEELSKEYKGYYGIGKTSIITKLKTCERIFKNN